MLAMWVDLVRSPESTRLSDHPAIALFDRLYRAWHRLDAPESKLPPLLSLSAERAWREHRLPDGTIIARGDRFGELHLDNAQVIALYARGLPSTQLGFEFRHQLCASLGGLAEAVRRGGRFDDLIAFSAITIFHHGLSRLGFVVEPGGLLAPRVTGAYQRALLRAVATRPRRNRRAVARRLWLSRSRLVSLYSGAPGVLRAGATTTGDPDIAA